jgi:hypothetical protein
MRKCLSLLLIVITYWMSTWMVTDIHDVVADGGDQLHPIFSAHSANSAIAFQSVEETAPSDCQVCSYDHGGHFGQTLPAAVPFVIFDHLGTACRSFYLPGWLSHTIPPKLRPPIA